MYTKNKIIPNALPSRLQYRARLIDNIAINEFDRLETLSVRDGYQFIPIPEVFDNTKVVQIQLVVDAIGIGTFDWSVTIGTNVETGTFPSNAVDQITDVSYVVNTSDKIFINITAISGVQPTGLTLVVTIVE